MNERKNFLVKYKKTTSNIINHKGQISIFFIIVIILVALSVIIVFLLLSNSHEKNNTPINFDVYKNKVENCLTNELERAIYLAFRQGGFIYESQGGGIKIDPSSKAFINYRGFYIPYYIDSLSPKITTVVYERPKGFPFNCSVPYDKNHNNISNVKDNCIKSYNINSLLRIGGSEDKDIKEIIERRVTKNIETYIKNNGKKCFVNDENFEVVNKDLSKYNVSIILNRKDISVRLKLPVKIRKRGTNEIKSYEIFNGRIDGRFLEFLKLIEDVLYNETHFANYEPSGNINNFSLRVLRGIDPGKNFDDIIEIEDNKTIIFGDTLKFMAGRKNRAPLIYEMPEAPSGVVKYYINFSWYYPFNETLNSILSSPTCSDTALKRNLTYFFYNLTGFIKAVDPDNDPLIYQDNIEDYTCIKQPLYFNYNVSDGQYVVKVYSYLDYGS